MKQTNTMLYDQLREGIIKITENLISRDDMKARNLIVKDVFISKSSRPLLRIYLDKEGGIGTTDLVYFHKEFEVLLDTENLIKSDYTLEVSSPGEAKKS